MPRLLYFLLRCSTVKLIIICTQIYLYSSFLPLCLCPTLIKSPFSSPFPFCSTYCYSYSYYLAAYSIFSSLFPLCSSEHSHPYPSQLNSAFASLFPFCSLSHSYPCSLSAGQPILIHIPSLYGSFISLFPFFFTAHYCPRFLPALQLILIPIPFLLYSSFSSPFYTFKSLYPSIVPLCCTVQLIYPHSLSAQQHILILIPFASSANHFPPSCHKTNSHPYFISA
jgi:hypothetical protein